MFCCFQCRGLTRILKGNYLMSYANLNCVIIKMYFSCLFLIWKYTADFCVLTFFPETLWNSPFNFNGLWVFHVLNHMVHKLWWFYVFLSNFYDIVLWFYFFFLSYFMAWDLQYNVLSLLSGEKLLIFPIKYNVCCKFFQKHFQF